MGFYSLAAAVLGSSVVAFEARQPELLSLQASLAYNALADLVTVHQVTSAITRIKITVLFY